MLPFKNRLTSNDMPEWRLFASLKDIEVGSASELFNLCRSSARCITHRAEIDADFFDEDLDGHYIPELSLKSRIWRYLLAGGLLLPIADRKSVG